VKVGRLNGGGRISGGPNFASFCDSVEPVLKAVGGIAWTHDQTGANDEIMLGKPFFCLNFAKWDSLGICVLVVS
jgi:hypothetical protein